MNLIDKYIGKPEKQEDTLSEEELNEINGRGRATPLNMVKRKDNKKVIKLLKKNKIPFEDVKGTLIIGDDDFDEVEELLIRQLGIF